MQLNKYLLLLTIAVLFCSDINPPGYSPIFMTRDEMENAVRLESPRPMLDPGKIYYKQPYLYIVEKYKGVHIFDNSNPENPENIGFIHIDGIRDIAMKSDVLYADNSVDLIAVQINSPVTSVVVTKRLRNYFQEMLTPDGLPLASGLYNNKPANSILVGWKTNNSDR